MRTWQKPASTKTDKTSKPMPQLSRDDLIRLAVAIAREYSGKMTIRQLYYQFVTRGYFKPKKKGDGQRFYKRIVAALTVARLDGRFPMDWVSDRTRESKASYYLKNDVDVDQALDKAVDAIRELPDDLIYRSPWYDQKTYVTVGVEKEALAGLFDEPCRRLGIGLFIFRGYASISSLYEYATQLSEVPQDKAVMLYFGDHDPDGFEIPRSAERNVEQIAEIEDLYLPDFRIKRVAITPEQIRQFNAPPFDAKVDSTRYASYVREHQTTDAWELDALPPDELDRLIRKLVWAEMDRKVYDKNVREVRAARSEMADRMRAPGWIDQVFEGEDNE